MLSSTTKINNETVFYENHTYDKRDNKIRSDENGRITEYRYDGMDRLSGVTADGKETIYEFDCFNNISKEHVLSGSVLSTTRYYYDIGNRLVLSESGTNIISYDYDKAGNLVKKSSKNSETRYSYDGYNRLTEVIKDGESYAYEYSPDGYRDKKISKDGTTRFIYDNSNVTAEILPNGDIYTYYRADGLIGSVNTKGEELYYVQNSHGDVVKLYSLYGESKKDYAYTPYGKEKTILPNYNTNKPFVLQWHAETTKVHNPFRYAGEYTDDETNLIYLRNRYYDSSVGRFISEDPVRDGNNWYVYCENNPVNYIDFTGLQAVKTLGEFWDGTIKYSLEDSLRANELSNKAKSNAISYADKMGYYTQKTKFRKRQGFITYKSYITWDNPVDAMRHMEWNSMMIRELGYEKACFFANNHETAELERLDWIEKIEDGVITTKMNQPTLMDIWNNSTGRALALDESLSKMNYKQLFEHAMHHDMLITDATTAYQFYGVTDYVNEVDWTVNVKWDTNNGTITFQKENLSDLTLTVGRWGV